MTPTPPNRYLADVLDQPAALRASLDRLLVGGAPAAIRAAARRGTAKVVFAGMGSSHFAALGPATALNAAGRTATVVSAGHLLHYELGSIDDRTLLVLVSQSGESGEIVRLIDRLPRSVPVVGVTNDSASALGRRADYLLGLNVAAEASVTTRTYLASVVALLMLADGLLDQDLDAFAADARDAIDALAAALAGHAETATALRSFVGVPPAVSLIGRGHSLATVRAGALFVREVAKHAALDFDAGEFRHGPFEMVEPGFAAVVFAPPGAGYAPNVNMARDIARRGGRAVLVTPEPPAWAEDNVLIVPVPATRHERFAPLVEVVPVQLLANNLAEAKGYDVGAFRWSSKVTTIE